MADEGYKVGPAYVYAYDDINISETSTSQQDILKIVPDSLPGYSVDKAVYLSGRQRSHGNRECISWQVPREGYQSSPEDLYIIRRK